MASPLTPGSELWWELLLAFGVGATLIVAVAAAASWCTRSAVWQSAVWRVAMLGLFALVALEFTGVGPGVARLFRQEMWQSAPATATTEPAPAATTRRPTDVPLPVPETTSAATQIPDVLAAAPVVAIRSEPYADRAALTTVPSSLEPMWTWWPALVWALGAGAVLGWMAWSHVMLWVFRRRSTPMCDEPVRSRLNVLAARLGIRRPVAALMSTRLSSPVVLGIARPTLVLPAGFAGDFDEQQQEAVLAHELAHLAWRDPAWQSAALILCSLLWWHPLAWWARRRLHATSEAAADEASLLVPDGPRALAESLVLLGRRLIQPRPFAGLSIEGNGFRSGLGRRVERLLKLRRSSWRAPGRGRLAFAHVTLPLVLALMAILGTAWAPSQALSTHGDSTMTLLTSSWRCSVAATALWALLGSSPNAALADDKPAEKANAEKASAEKARSVTPEREQLYNQLRSIRQKAEQLEKEGKHDQAERLKGEAKELMAKLHASAGQPGPGGTSTSNPERERLYNQLRSMRQKVEQLEKDGKHDEAERLKGETKELMAKLQASAGRSGPGGMSASNPDRERLYNQLRSIRQKVEQLEKDGKHEEAERLKGEAKELMAKLQASAGRSGAGGMSSSNPEQEKMRQKLMAIGQRVEQLEKEGKHDEAERVKSEAKGIMARLNPHAQPSPGDMGARMQHLRTAAENLMAAGCEPEARHVMEMIQQMESQMREGGRPMLAPGAAAPEQANARMVQELRGQVEQLSRQMQEMREQLNRSKEHGDRK